MPEDLLTEETSDQDQEIVELKVTLSGDRTEVRLDCPDPLSNLEEYVDEILDQLDVLDVAEIPDSTLLTERIKQSAQPGEDLVDLVLIQSQKPVPTIHGTLTWTRDFFAEGFKIDEETGAIDYREKLANGSVRRNELLARITEPVEGTPGMDVLGNVIGVDKPENYSLRFGKGVVQVPEEQATNYHAEFDGRVIFKDNTLTVDDLYVVQGNLDLKSGNIRHTGSVTISGDICIGAQIEADGDILVQGLVEQCNIRCGGNLIVAGGIIGDEEHSIQVGGKVEAKYIRDAQLTALGNILVAKQISHSQVSTTGWIQIHSGRIAGGTTSALKGMQLETAGAPGSSDTVLIVGVDFSLDDRITLCKATIDQLESNLRPIQAAMNNLDKRSEVAAETVNKIKQDLADRFDVIQASIERERQSIQDLKNSENDSADMTIVLTKDIWAGTTILMGEAKTRVKDTIESPRLVQLKDGEVHVLPLGEGNMPGDDFCA